MRARFSLSELRHHDLAAFEGEDVNFRPGGRGHPLVACLCEWVADCLCVEVFDGCEAAPLAESVGDRSTRPVREGGDGLADVP